MKTIDHDPKERPRIKKMAGIWYVVAVILAFLWVGQWYFHGFEWGNLALGLGTGVLFAYFVIDFHLSSGGRIDEL